MLLGYSKVNITPPILTCSNGGMYYSPTEFHIGVHDDLYARTLVLKDGDTCAAIVSMDLINIPKLSVIPIKRMIKEYCDIPEKNIILHATHQHSGPFSYRFKEGIRNNEYWIVTEQKIAGSVYMAFNNLEECLIGAGKSILSETLNRRVLHPDGSVLYLPAHPGLVPNQPVDNEVGIISFRKPDREPLVTLMNYSCRPLIVGFLPRLISADFPGEAVNQVERQLSGHALFTNGASGNIHAKKHCEGFEAMEEFGATLASRVIRTMPFIHATEGEHLQVKQKTITLELIPEKIKFTEDIQQFHKGNKLDFEITLLSFNNIALVAFPAEYFVELQLEIKNQSPIKHTYLLTMSNGYCSYIPDKKAYDQEAYESNSAKFSRGAGEQIRDTILEMLSQIAPPD